MKNRIRFLRVEKGWTQHALANRVGITRMMISLFEHWRRDPSLALAYRFADAFEKRIDEVFPHEPETLPPEEPEAKPGPRLASHQTLVPKRIGGTRGRLSVHHERHRKEFVETQSRARLCHFTSLGRERSRHLSTRYFHEGDATCTFE